MLLRLLGRCAGVIPILLALSACEVEEPPTGPLSDLARPLPGGQAFGSWTWVETPGAVCRDGSPAGYYHRRGQADDLLIFLNGGGACSDAFFCGINPVNVNQNLPTEALLDATGNLIFGPNAERQVAPNEGIFRRDPRNPVGDWSMIYVPYCTGDIHAGMRPNATVPGVPGVQQFVGYRNMGLFLESFGPSFARAKRVLLAGSSAGGFGALMNYDRVQTFFNQHGGARVIAVSDSGVPFGDQHMAPCLQKRWRDLWNLNAALPQDCAGCFNADGGGIAEGLGHYLFDVKYPDRMFGGFLSTTEDGVIRAFYAPGLNNCTIDPGINTVLSGINLGSYSGVEFTAGLKDAMQNVANPEQVATYTIQAWQHMHLWRPRYYERNGNALTIAEWVGDIIEGVATHQGLQENL